MKYIASSIHMTRPLKEIIKEIDDCIIMAFNTFDSFSIIPMEDWDSIYKLEALSQELKTLDKEI